VTELSTLKSLPIAKSEFDSNENFIPQILDHQKYTSKYKTLYD